MSLLAIVPCAAVWSAELGVSRSTRVVPAVTAPVVDGVLDEACWGGEPAFQEFQSADDPDRLHPNQTRGWTCYDTRHMYVAAVCDLHDVDALRQCLAESPEKVRDGNWRSKSRLFERGIDCTKNPRLPRRPAKKNPEGQRR